MLPTDTKHVLLCLRYGIGDVVMSLPALDALRSALPAAHITALANPPANELLEGDARVDEIVVATRWGLNHRWDEGDEPTRRAIADWMRERDFDLVLEAEHATTAVAQAIWSLGIRSLEGCARTEAATLEAGGSGAEAIAAGIRAGWGIDVPTEWRPVLRPGPAHAAEAAAALDAAGVADGQRPFAVSPVSSTPMKGWPIDRFAAVAEELAERSDAPILILEGPQPETGEALRAALPDGMAAARVAPLHLLSTAALLARCAALVCNDTGVMHIAAAVGTPTVAAFGPTRADIFLPPASHAAAAEPADLECAWRDTSSLHPPACWVEGRCFIAEHSCIRRTRVDDVLAALDSVIARAGRVAVLSP